MYRRSSASSSKDKDRERDRERHRQRNHDRERHDTVRSSTNSLCSSSSTHTDYSRKMEDNEEYPPLSRIFLTGINNLVEEEILQKFKQFGKIKNIRIVTDRATGTKEIAYIQYSKTSEAAKAMQEMNGKIINSACSRPVNIYVASSKSEGSGRNGIEDKCDRLFVIIERNVTEEDLHHEFKKYGDLQSVVIVRDKITKEHKGCAYVKYFKFYHAAIAFENCQPKFKALFAEPKASKDNKYEKVNDNEIGSSRKRPLVRGNSAQLKITCSSTINQDQLWKLFDIVPGLEYCQINHSDDKLSYAVAVFHNLDSAEYAQDKLDGFEYPPGHKLIVNMVTDILTLETSVELPEVEPLVAPDSVCEFRCFIICSPKPLSPNVILNVFSRFGNLIEAYLLKHRNYGFAKYSKEESALMAIETLHDAEICGVNLKVVKAEDQEPHAYKSKRLSDISDDEL